MKIAFFGTGEFSKNILDGVLADPRVDIKLVVSQADKPFGRKQLLKKTPVKILAEANNLEILQPEKLLKNSDFLDYLDSLELDFILVVAYGKIVPKRVLNAAKYGCINLHGSILPKYRGASPIQEAVKNGDKQTGLTVMFMSKGMDEGDVLKIEEVNIDNDDTTEDIFRKFEEFGSTLAIDTLVAIGDGKLLGTAQEHENATYCSKITKEHGEVNFLSEKSTDIYNKYRAYKIWPGIYCFYKNVKLNIETCEIFDNYDLLDLGDKQILSWEKELIVGEVIRINKKNIGVVCSDKKILILKQVKLAGKKSMDILSFINGNKDFLEYKF